MLSDDDEYPEPSLPSSDNNTESDEDCGVGPKKKQALGTEVVESKSTPVKKEALASDDVKCNTSPVSNVFDIGGKKKVTVSQFKGRKLVDIREFYTDSSGVEKVGCLILNPITNIIQLTYSQLHTL